MYRRAGDPYGTQTGGNAGRGPGTRAHFTTDRSGRQARSSRRGANYGYHCHRQAWLLMRPLEGPPKARWHPHHRRWHGYDPPFDLRQGSAAHPRPQLYNNLVRTDIPSGFKQLIPDLAERWEVSSDGKVCTFSFAAGSSGTMAPR